METARSKRCPLTGSMCRTKFCAWWCGFADDCAVPLLAGMFADSPTHIDRETLAAEWKDSYKSGVHAGDGYVCSFCDMWSGRKSHICPNCGKAMDEYGLAMLEKRLMW